MFWWRDEVQPGVSVAFTDINAGNLALHVGDDPVAVRARRAALEASLDLRNRSFQYMNQVHGNNVALVRRAPSDAGLDSRVAAVQAPTADAMVSQGWPLAVMVADCVPVVLVGEAGAANPPVTAVVHAGRPGVAARVVPAAVQEMRGLGATVIRAWLGPSICGSCYEVPDDLRDEVARTEPATWSTTSWNTPALDLPAGVRAQLEASGVVVELSGTCTLEDEGLFSYRRNSKTGRFAGLVWTHD